MRQAYERTAFLLGDVVEADDAYTGAHSKGVVALVDGVAEILELSRPDRDRAKLTALLHDVGKINIPKEIINKPGKLTPEERARSSRPTPSRASSSWSASAACSARSACSCAPATSTSTATATRTVWWARRSRSSPASSAPATRTAR